VPFGQLSQVVGILFTRMTLMNMPGLITFRAPPEHDVEDCQPGADDRADRPVLHQPSLPSARTTGEQIGGSRVRSPSDAAHSS
jgi:hypothetical protein